MDLNDVLTLVKAGYTKEEISQMTALTSTKGDNPAPAKDPAGGTPDPEPVPEPAPEQKPASAETEYQKNIIKEAAADTEYQKLEKLLNQFINTAQAQNLNGSMNAAAPQQRTTQDILASVIAPPARKENNK